MGKWEEKRFDDIVESNLIGLVRSKKEQSDDYDIMYLKMNNITNDGNIVHSNIINVNVSKEECQRYSLKQGDFLFNTRNSVELVGKTGVFLLEGKYVYNNNILRTRFIKNIDPKFINYQFHSSIGKAKLEKIKSGTTNVAAIYYKSLKDVLLLIPPLNTQKQIVSKLDALFARIDKSIGLLEGNIQHTKDLMASVLDGEFGKLGEKFGKKALNDICVKITDGSHHSPKAIEKGYPYVTVKDINNKGEIDLINCKKISEMDYAELLKTGCQPQKGDVLLSKDGTVGKVAIVDFEKDWVVLSSLAIIRPNVDILKSEYLSLMLQTPIFQKTAIGLKTGAAIKRIVLRTIKTMEIPAPNLKEQEKAIVKIHDLRKPLNNLITQQSEKLKHLQSLKSSLLDMAFKGDLV